LRYIFCRRYSPLIIISSLMGVGGSCLLLPIQTSPWLPILMRIPWSDVLVPVVPPGARHQAEHGRAEPSWQVGRQWCTRELGEKNSCIGREDLAVWLGAVRFSLVGHSVSVTLLGVLSVRAGKWAIGGILGEAQRDHTFYPSLVEDLLAQRPVFDKTTRCCSHSALPPYEASSFNS